MKITEKHHDDLRSTEYRLDFWGLDFDKLQEYVKRNGSRTVPLDILNDTLKRYSTKILISDETVNIMDRPEQYVKHELVNELASALYNEAS